MSCSPGAAPPRFAVEARSHNRCRRGTVAQGRADWGLAIAPVAASYGTGLPPGPRGALRFRHPPGRWDRPAVAAFRALLDNRMCAPAGRVGMKSFTTETRRARRGSNWDR
jgi:putative molybdopterin biosynthesis protein